MYKETITLFNRYNDSMGNTMWFPRIISGANLMNDKSAIISKYGEVSKDKAVLNIAYKIESGLATIKSKRYLSPKEWKRQTIDNLPQTITFASGNDFDFFMIGDYGSEEPIIDDTGRFYSNIQSEYDYVYAITSVTQYTIIPHFEITGK